MNLKLPRVYWLFSPIIGLLLSVYIFPAFAQQQHLTFTNYTINNGLSEGTISCITQDRQGFMWFGTQDGLDRFDGYEFMVYRHDPFNSRSLSDNTVTALFTDSRGELWIGTLNGGLDLFDPEHEQFFHLLKEDTGVSSNIKNAAYIRSIIEDKKGRLWIGTFGDGIFEFIFNNRKTGRLPFPEKILHYTNDGKNGLKNNYIVTIYADKDGHLWVAENNHQLQMADLNGNSIYFSTPLFISAQLGRTVAGMDMQFNAKHITCSKAPVPYPNIVYSIYEDKSGTLWFGGNGGFYNLKDGNDTLRNFDLDGFPSLGLASIYYLYQGSAGRQFKNCVWLGAWNGLGVFNLQDFTLRLIKNRPGNDESLLAGRITCIYKDRSGCLWLGTNGYGISKYDPRSSLFSSPLNYISGNDTILNRLSVMSFLETKNYLLLGAYDGFYQINKANGNVAQINVSYLVDNMVMGDSGEVWLAGGNGLTMYSPANNKQKTYLLHIIINNEDDDRIIKIYNTHQGGLWLLTTHTFSYFDIATKKFTNYYYRRDMINHVYYPSHGDIYRDPDGNFWLGTEVGLLYFDTAKKTFQYYTTNAADTSSLSFNVVECVVPDPRQPKKYLWIGTSGGGLNKFNLRTKKFIHFTIKKGLPDNFINGILTDNKGYLWISTNKGISRFDPVNNVFRNYDVREGLVSNEFNPGAYYRSREGRFFFGSIDGFNSFYPDSIKANLYFPPIVFTDFRLFNGSALLKGKNSPLKQSITTSDHIALSYKDNLMTFQVAALGYSETYKNQYAYRLEGFNDNWINLGTDRLITFSNLRPGHYILQVKASNNEGVWDKKYATMAIHILPPWWRTWWAYLFYFMVALVLIWLLRMNEISRLRLKNNLQLEHFEAEKLKEVDHMKSRFFANISHEFRTPLTLIIGPLKDMMQEEDLKKFSSIIPAMYRNSQRLLQLINQLLDLSRLDEGKYHINTTRTDIVSFVKQITGVFLNLAKRKNIEFNVRVDEDLVRELHNGDKYFYFDEDIVEKVLTNLISNAFKFTQEGGEITVLLEICEEDKNYLALKVKDTGTGIPSEKIPYVFDRFYQADDSSKKRFEGSGIGLALVKELMELHGGKVSAASSPGEGTAFTCLFPFNKKFIAVGQAQIEEKPDKVNLAHDNTTVLNQEGTGEDGKPHVVVIEDNADVRQYICDKLRDEYYLIQCKDGKEGLEATLNDIPDLVISDVMMPEMDGFELCKALKTDLRTSHVPVILLTAKAEDTDRIQGLETGADAYLIKPFNAKELQVRVSKLIELRNKMRAKFGEKLIVKPGEIAVSQIDREFVEKLKKVTEVHIDDRDFKMGQLCTEMNMSLSHLNRKLKAVINQTASQYMVSIRMQRALVLLQNNEGSIGEIAWKTGFEDQGYFSKVFKNYYGFLPSEKEKFSPDA